MNQSDWAWGALVLGVGVAALILYLRGWRRMRLSMASLASTSRLAAFVLATFFVFAALASPLATLSQTHFLARTAQQVMLCIVAPPLFWLACPFHISAWGAPVRARRWIARWFVRPSRIDPVLRVITYPGVVWLLFLSSLLIWHDPTFVDATVPRPLMRMASLFWLFIIALLFWWQITANGPRRYTQRGYLARLAMLISVEMANVATGVIIAFAATSLYSVYGVANSPLSTAPPSFLPPVADQFLGGILTWIFGSMVYITSAILVMNQVFRREGSEQPQPLADWDAEEKFIAPGLEERLREVGWERHDWKKH